MKTRIRKTVVVECTEAQAFYLKAFIEAGLQGLKDLPDPYVKHAKRLLDQFTKKGI